MDNILTVKEKLNLLKSINNDGGNLVHLKDELYAFVYSDNKMKLVSLTDDVLFFEEDYNLKYIGDYVIVLSKHSHLTNAKSKIIDRKTFNVLYEFDKLTGVSNRIIYESDCIYGGSTKDKDIRTLLDLKGNLLLIVDGGPDFEINCTDNEEYYIVSYRETSKFERVYTLLHYDLENNILKEVWTSDKYDIDTIGENLLMFSDREDFSKVWVYDILNKKLM